MFPAQIITLKKWWQPQHTVLAVMWLVYGCFYLNRLNFAPVIPLIMEELKLSHTQVGLISSFFFGFYTVSQFFTGYLSDIQEARKIITLGSAISVVAGFFFSTGTRLFHLAGAQIFNGLGQGAGWGPSVKLLSHWFPPAKMGRVLGIYATSISIFTILTYAFTGYIGKTFGWRSVFQAFPMLFIPVILVFWIIARDNSERHDIKKIETGYLKETVEFTRNKNRYFSVISIKEFRLASLGFFCLLYISYTNLIWVPSYLHESHGLNVVKAGLFASLYPALGLLARPLGGYLSDITFGGRRKPLILIGFLFMALSNLFLGFVSSMGWDVSLILCVGFFDQLIVTLFMALLLDLLPGELIGTAVGFLEAFGHIGTISAMFFCGLLIDFFHSYKPVFLMLSILACGGIVATLFISEKKQFVNPDNMY